MLVRDHIPHLSEVIMPRIKPTWRRRHPGRQLANLPRIYSPVPDIRPEENEGQSNSEVVLVSGEVSVLPELNHRVLGFLSAKDFIRFGKVSQAAKRVVSTCKALLYDAIRTRICDYRVPYHNRLVRGQQFLSTGLTNMHRFEIGNRVVCAMGDNLVFGRNRVHGYCVGVTHQYVHIILCEHVFNSGPVSERVKSQYAVEHVRPYVGKNHDAYVVQNWHSGPRVGNPF